MMDEMASISVSETRFYDLARCGSTLLVCQLVRADAGDGAHLFDGGQEVLGRSLPRPRKMPSGR